MTGFTLDYTKHCQLEFGSYVEAHEDHDNLTQSGIARADITE
jgi:hypothetical protein